MNKVAIICVDDEKIVLSSLKTELKKALNDNYIIETAESAEDALTIFDELTAESFEIPLIISDYLMPIIKGDELLKRIHHKYPKSLKIMLTGQATVEGVSNAINWANLYRYIGKPWEKNDLILTVKEAISSFYKDKKLEEQNEQLLIINQSLEQKVKERTKEIEEKNIILEKQKDELNLRNQEITSQRDEIDLQKKKSDELLLNILPSETAEELKLYGHSNARFYHMVTVLFTDVKDFSKIAEKLSAEKLVAELDYCFKIFDQIIDKYNVEKIKTIGDSYMCAGGIPVENTTNPSDVIKLGLEIQQFMNSYKKEREENDKPYFEIRIGIHTGHVVAGIVGLKKFAYDIWGDTVNIASRMESAGEVGKVNISNATYELIKNNFYCTHRGKVPVKNKGEIDMYFVDGIISEKTN